MKNTTNHLLLAYDFFLGVLAEKLLDKMRDGRFSNVKYRLLGTVDGLYSIHFKSSSLRTTAMPFISNFTTVQARDKQWH